MDRLEKQRFIRQKARENRDDPEGAKIFWSRHAIVEMINDKLTRTEVERALEQGQIIEDYPAGHRPLPDCLVLASLAGTHPLHAVVAVDEVQDRILIVTVYLPSKEEWQDDWQPRK
jgi:hypothetical protein